MFRVRYKEFSGWSPWIVCRDVDVRDGCLVIEQDGGEGVFVPLHVIRGQVRVEAVK